MTNKYSRNKYKSSQKGKKVEEWNNKKKKKIKYSEQK